MDPAHLETLCKAFDIGTLSGIQEDHEGILNRNYLLTTDKGKYFVKSLRDKRKADAPYIAAVEEFMFSRGIPAICMMPTVSGEKYEEINSSIYTVYPFVESDRSHMYSSDDFTMMGKMLGMIHRAGSSDVPPALRERSLKTRPYDTAEELASYKTIIAAKDVLTDIDRQFLSYIDLKLKIIATFEEQGQILCDTLIHGDYHTRNLFLDANRKIIGICDWEQGRMAPRAYELARSVQYMCFSGNRDVSPEIYDVSQALASAHAFITGYQEVYPISTEEMRAGFDLRLKKLCSTTWIEDSYYALDDARALLFIPHEMRLIREFGQENMFERLA